MRICCLFNMKDIVESKGCTTIHMPHIYLQSVSTYMHARIRVYVHRYNRPDPVKFNKIHIGAINSRVVSNRW